MISFNLSPLEKDFKSQSIKRSFLPLYQCLGFITAIASSPAKVKPSEWIKQLVTKDDKTPEFDSQAHAKEFSQNLVAWWKHCDQHFDQEFTLSLPEKLTLTPKGKPSKALSEFSTGYIIGYEWLSQAWKTMLPNDLPEAERSLKVLNVILMAFVDEKTIQQESPELLAQLPDLEGRLKALPGLLSAVGMLGKDLSIQSEKSLPLSQLARKNELNSAAQGQRNYTKITPLTNKHRHMGRNDPCHCGSGKKFKKCCLH